jgi:ubiquinone/menaquinone biosynthesis C-methylase UbiE
LCILELNHNVTDMVEFGSGYGTFTIPAAKIVKGIVYAIDIEEEMIKRVAKRVSEEKLNNIINNASG